MSEDNGFRYGLGIAFRLGTELLVATALGAVMGYALDDFLDTSPWFLILGVFMGGAAGCLNAYRVAQMMNQSSEEHKDNDHTNNG